MSPQEAQLLGLGFAYFGLLLVAAAVPLWLLWDDWREDD